MSHTPGIAAMAPARHKTIVSAAPTTKGGTKLNTNFLAGADQTGSPAFDALRHIARIPIAMARTPSISHVVSQAPGDVCLKATKLAPTAVTPMATPPQPGTAVNEPARSMVSRI